MLFKITVTNCFFKKPNATLKLSRKVLTFFNYAVPDNNELARGTLRAILYQASFSVDEFNVLRYP